MNWYSEDYSFDICFCGMDCGNIKCHRNKRSEHYKAMIKQQGFHSMSDFGGKCDGREKVTQ